jgi:hypothetical protein
MNVMVNDGRTPNPQGIARTNNLMPNGGYIPRMEMRNDFIPLNYKKLHNMVSDKNPSTKDLKLFNGANFPDPTMNMKPCKDLPQVGIINPRNLRRSPLSSVNSVNHRPLPIAGARNNPIGIAQEKEQIFASQLNNFDSFYPNLSAGKMGRYPNQVPMGR